MNNKLECEGYCDFAGAEPTCPAHGQFKAFPTLYKKTATGAVQQWKVMVIADEERTFPFPHAESTVICSIGMVVTEYGQVNGLLQKTSDTITEGKNLGRSNATTAIEQAMAQAQQQWDKKRKQGYVPDLELASSTDNALDAIKPMLAHVYEDHPKKVSWPAYVQPKLDGMRCIAIVKDGVCKLYSRTQKLIETVPHINRAVEKLAGGENLILDGELYNHDFKNDFNRIMSIVKRDEVHPDHELVQYHVYDLPSYKGSFEARNCTLWNLAEWTEFPALRFVETETAESEEDLMKFMSEMIEIGYEGAMYRHTQGHYEGKRSHGLLKVKTFRDEEFVVVGVEEGNGKLQGKAGAIWCMTKDGKRFKAKMQGALESLTDYLVNFETKYVGRMLTVKFQNYTPDGVPRFPVGIRFREAE